MLIKFVRSVIHGCGSCLRTGTSGSSLFRRRLFLTGEEGKSIVTAGHREGDIRLSAARALSNAFDCTVTVLCGIHFDAISKNETKGSKVAGAQKYGIADPDWKRSFQLGAKIPLKDSDIWGGSLSYNRFFCGYGIVGAKLEFLSFGRTYTEYDEDWGEYREEIDPFLVGLHVNLGCQLPINLNHFILAPYITGGICISNAGAIVMPLGGMRVGYEFKNSTFLFLDANYTYRYRVVDFSGDINPHSVEVGLGVAW